MMNFMPFMMGLFFFKLASGLVLYILTSNLIATSQQWFLYKVIPDALPDSAKKKGAADKKAKELR